MTSALSCSSLQPSVPSGRNGILKNLSTFSEVGGRGQWIKDILGNEIIWRPALMLTRSQMLMFARRVDDHPSIRAEQ